MDFSSYKGVAWYSRHPLSQAQKSAITELFGEDAKIEQRPQTFPTPETLLESINSDTEQGLFSFVVTAAPWLLFLASKGIDFGTFQTEPSARQKGVFELKQVWTHYTDATGKFKTEVVLENKDGDEGGDALIPVAREV